MESKLNCLVRYPILFVGCPCPATADLVRGRVSKGLLLISNLNRGLNVSPSASLRIGWEHAARVSAGPLPLSRCTVILGCLLLDFDWTSRYREASSKTMGLEDGVFRHLVAVTVHVTFVYGRPHTFYSCAPLHLCHVRWSPWLAGPNQACVVFSQSWRLYTGGDRCNAVENSASLLFFFLFVSASSRLRCIE